MRHNIWYVGTLEIWSYHKGNCDNHLSHKKVMKYFVNYLAKSSLSDPEAFQGSRLTLDVYPKDPWST